MPKINPRTLSFIILITGIFLAIFSYPFFSGVFGGSLKLKQEIEIFQMQQEIVIGDFVIPPALITVRYYSICVALGVLFGYLMSLYLYNIHYLEELGNKSFAFGRRITGTLIDRLFIGLIFFGIIGARLFYVAFNWEKFAENPMSIILDMPQGGMAIFGGLLAGFIYIFLYSYFTGRIFENIAGEQNEFLTFDKTSRKVINLEPFFKVLDIVTPGLLLGQIIGRFGNFFNYEAYGPSTSVFWKMYVPDTANFYENLNQKFFHPTFLYEIIPNFFLLVWILFFYTKTTKRHYGHIFATYLIGYGTIRFFTEFFRLDALSFQIPNLSLSWMNLDHIAIAQVLCIIMIFGGLIILFGNNLTTRFVPKKMEFGKIKAMPNLGNQFHKVSMVDRVWQWHSRFLAILSIVVYLYLFYSSASNIPQYISVDASNYEIASSNIVFDTLRKKPRQEIAVKPRDAEVSEMPNNKVFVDETTQKLNQKIKEAGIQSGEIDASLFVEYEIDTNVKPDNKQVEQNQEPKIDRPKKLDEIMQRPETPVKTNFLRYPRFNVNAPIVYTTLEDLFGLRDNCNPEKEPDGCIDFNKKRDTSDVNTPVQKKLEQGIVHIAYTPMPGEVGNSYIIGHSSNYAWIKSNYNKIFKPLEKKSEVGDEFFIYDYFGRELKFKVFEVKEIRKDEVEEAYKDVDQRRVVTLQTSIVAWDNTTKSWEPNYRWLTRGELVLDE
jgi:phosphatidylglycerol:prolipoprotein diacylglycerol transferase